MEAIVRCARAADREQALAELQHLWAEADGDSATDELVHERRRAAAAE